MPSLIGYAIESREQSKAPVTISSRFPSPGESGPKHTGQARTSIAWARTGPLTKGCRDSIILRLKPSTRIPRFYLAALVLANKEQAAFDFSNLISVVQIGERAIDSGVEVVNEVQSFDPLIKPGGHVNES